MSKDSVSVEALREEAWASIRSAGLAIKALMDSGEKISPQMKTIYKEVCRRNPNAMGEFKWLMSDCPEPAAVRALRGMLQVTEPQQVRDAMRATVGSAARDLAIAQGDTALTLSPQVTQ